jgi:hypothetical protein
MAEWVFAMEGKSALPRSNGVYLMAITDHVRHYFILRLTTTVIYFSTRGTRTYPRVLEISCVRKISMEFFFVILFRRNFATGVLDSEAATAS